MLQHPDFDSKSIDPNLNERMAKAVDEGRIKRFNRADGDQDLNFWSRETWMEDVVWELMEDPIMIFKCNQNSHFEMDLDELGQRLFGGEANAGVSFQIGRLRYIPVHTGTYWYILVHTGIYLVLTCFECDGEQVCK
jgi:hypothetical protein